MTANHSDIIMVHLRWPKSSVQISFPLFLLIFTHVFPHPVRQPVPIVSNLRDPPCMTPFQSCRFQNNPSLWIFSFLPFVRSRPPREPDTTSGLVHRRSGRPSRSRRDPPLPIREYRRGTSLWPISGTETEFLSELDWNFLDCHPSDSRFVWGTSTHQKGTF